MSTVNLKGCPFCGGEIKNYSIGYRGPVAISLDVSCDDCHAEIKIEIPMFYANFESFFLEDAVDIFNTRAGPQNQQGL